MSSEEKQFKVLGCVCLRIGRELFKTKWQKEFPQECFYKKLTPSRVAKCHGYNWLISIYPCKFFWQVGVKVWENMHFVKMNPFWGNNKISVSKLACFSSKQILHLWLHLFSALVRATSFLYSSSFAFFLQQSTNHNSSRKISLRALNPPKVKLFINF